MVALNLATFEAYCNDILLVLRFHFLETTLNFAFNNTVCKDFGQWLFFVLDNIGEAETIGTENAAVLVNVNSRDA